MNEPRLARQLTLFDGVAVVVGIIVAAGIFALPGRVAQYSTGFAESATLWTVAGLFSLLGALVYAELAERMPETGGEYIYLQKSFGPFPAFLYGWTQLLVIRTAPGATQSLVFAEYLNKLVPLSPAAQMAVAAVLLWTLAAVNYRGLQTGRMVQRAATTAKIGGMLILLGAGVWSGLNTTNLTATHVPASPDRLSNFTGAMLLVVFTYLGWDRLGQLAGEMKNPQKDIRRVLVWSVGLVIILYVCIAAVIHSAIPVGQLAKSGTAAGDAVRILAGPLAETFLAVLVLVATSSSINANMLASSRVYYAMGRDGFLSERLGRVHPEWRSPHIAVLAHVTWASCLLFAYRAIEGLIGSQVFSMTLWYSVMAVAYLKLPRSRRIIAVPFLIGLMLLAIATLFTRPQMALINLAFIVTGIPVYFYFRRSSSA